MKKVISSEKFKAVGPYSQAVIHNGIIYLSGQICLNYETGKLERDSVASQTKRALQNIKLVLEEANSSLENVIKCNVYISSMEKFEEMNNVYKEFFPNNPPARVTVAVKELYDDLDVEMSAIAFT